MSLLNIFIIYYQTIKNERKYLTMQINNDPSIKGQHKQDKFVNS